MKKPWARKVTKRAASATASPMTTDETLGLSHEVDKALLSSLKADEDEVMLFLKSLAPKLRQVNPDDLLDVEIELMGVINRRLKPPPCSTSNYPTSGYPTSSYPTSDYWEAPFASDNP